MAKKSTKSFNLRRLVQFRLRTLLAVFLLAPLAVGWWHLKMQSYRTQQEALEELARFTPYVAFEPGRPAWLRHFADKSLFKDAVHVSFQGKRSFTDDDASYLANLRRLRRLSLQDTKVMDRGLRHIADLVELDTLSLENTRVTDDGLERLRGLQKLRVLQVSSAKVTGKGLRHLAGLPLLERVEVACQGMRDEDVAVFSQLPRLRELLVWTSELSDDGFASLRGLDKLERLELRGTSLINKSIEGMPNLRSLDVGTWRLYGLRVRDLPELAQLEVSSPLNGDLLLEDLPKLTKLDLYRQRVSKKTLESIASLTNLRELRMRQAKLEPAAWPHLGKMKNLRVLDLSGTEVGNELLKHVAELTSLEELHLANTTIDTKGLSHLKELARLKRLDLHDVPLFDTRLANTGSRGNLRHSEFFREIFVPDGGFRTLTKLPSLEQVNLAGTGIAVEEILMLRESPSIKLVGLDHASMGDRQRQKLSEALQPINITGPSLLENTATPTVGRGSRLITGNNPTHDPSWWERVPNVDLRYLRQDDGTPNNLENKMSE